MTTLKEFADDLRRAAHDVLDEGEKVVSKGAVNVKRDWRERWQGFTHAPALPRAITYDMTRSDASVSAEIGPDKDLRQGALGNLLEFGSVNNPPHPGGLPALAAEEPRFVNAVGDLGEKLLAER